jgi:hypothetical protein
MKTSESVKSIIPALITAQAKFKNPDKSKSGYGYKYADLPSILDMARPILAENGLCIVQSVDSDGESMVVNTRIYHSSGEFIGDSMRLLMDGKGKMNAMQSLGSAITYARRYSIQNLLGIVGDEDDDGRSSGQPRPQQAYNRQPNQAPQQTQQRPPVQQSGPRVEYDRQYNRR